jgi:hypothetical protein
MGTNKHSGGSATPWKGTVWGALGGLRQFCSEFADPGSCLGHLGLSGGNEALFFLHNGLGLTSSHSKFSFLYPLGLCVFCGLPLGLELSFVGAVNSGASLMRAGGGHGSHVPVVLRAGQNHPEKYP